MDTNKEAFRRYLESAGVVDALTKGWRAACWGLGHVGLGASRRTVCWPSGRGLASLRQAPPPPKYTVLVALYEEPDKPKQATE